MAGQRDIQDHWFREARREGYRSRAAYKLLEIDDRRHVLGPGKRVLDLGAAPGSWLQVAAARVGDAGLVVGIDLQAIAGGLPAHVHCIEEDATEASLASISEAIGQDPDAFDVLLSDMAPATTGHHTIDHHGSIRLCHSALDLATDLLTPGGHLVMKVFEGEAYKDLTDRSAEIFDAVRGFKPKASRSASTEIFVVCHDRREEIPPPMPVAPPPPPPGWAD